MMWSSDRGCLRSATRRLNHFMHLCGLYDIDGWLHLATCPTSGCGAGTSRRSTAPHTTHTTLVNHQQLSREQQRELSFRLVWIAPAAAAAARTSSAHSPPSPPPPPRCYHRRRSRAMPGPAARPSPLPAATAGSAAGSSAPLPPSTPSDARADLRHDMRVSVRVKSHTNGRSGGGGAEDAAGRAPTAPPPPLVKSTWGWVWAYVLQGLELAAEPSPQPRQLSPRLRAERTVLRTHRRQLRMDLPRLRPQSRLSGRG